MPTTNFDVVQANSFIGVDLTANPFGTTWYVATTGADGNDGKSAALPFLTIAKAISSGAANDNIVIGPGTYTITSALAPKARQYFRAAIVNGRYPTVVITGNIADLVQIDVVGTRWYGIEILASGNTADNLVDIADTAAAQGTTFVSCVFNGADKTSVVGVQADDGTYSCEGLTIMNCLFRDLTGTGLDIGVVGMPYALIEGNQFAIDANSATGIALADTSAFATGKGYVIQHNVFTGLDATADEVGITIGGTENTTGAGIIRNNYFAYIAAAAITIDKLSYSEVNNYVGDVGTGGTLVDPGAA